MVRAGIIGLGKMGVSHYAILRANQNVEQVAVCEPAAFIRAGLKKYLDVTTYKNPSKMFREANLDCVVIATPTKTHGELGKMAIGHGVATFMEKPFCLDVAEGRQLVELAGQKNLVTQVGYHNRFIGTFVEARRLLANGAIGKVNHVHGEAYGPVILKPQGSTWRSRKEEGGGCLHDYCSHVVDLMNFVVGPPASVAGAVMNRIYSRDVEDAVFATLRYQDGMSGQISVNWSDETHRKMTTRLTINGSEGKIVVDRQEIRVFLRADAACKEFPPGWTVRYITELQQAVDYYLRGEEYSMQMESFINAVMADSDTVSSFASAHQTDTVIHMLIQAARLEP